MRRRAALGLWCVLLLAGCQARAAPAAPPAASAAPAAEPGASAALGPEPPLAVVRVAHAGVAPEVAAVWLAVDLGLDRQYGLQIDLRQTRSAALSQAALLSGELDYAWTGLGPTLGARSGGSPVVFLGATSTRAASELVTQPTLAAPEQLRGATIGVHSLGGPPHLRTLAALKRLGLDPDRDRVTILVTGDEPTTAAALQERAIDGAPLSYASAAPLKEQGYHAWDLGALGVPDILGIVGLPATAHGRAEDTLRLLRAVAAGQAYLKAGATDPAAREQAAAVVARRMRASEIGPILHHLDRTRERVPLDLRVDLDDARELQASMGGFEPAILQIPLEEVLDLSFRDQLAAAGFFARLGAR
ncbi:MAG TPA: ABC transporter substrate-binding protein [Chloroflexota bacterium]|nr:ABC transporter substrate-binding protein [Chloroflexota bacterium]